MSATWARSPRSEGGKICRQLASKTSDVHGDRCRPDAAEPNLCPEPICPCSSKPARFTRSLPVTWCRRHRLSYQSEVDPGQKLGAPPIWTSGPFFRPHPLDPKQFLLFDPRLVTTPSDRCSVESSSGMSSPAPTRRTTHNTRDRVGARPDKAHADKGAGARPDLSTKGRRHIERGRPARLCNKRNRTATRTCSCQRHWPRNRANSTVPSSPLRLPEECAELIAKPTALRHKARMTIARSSMPTTSNKSRPQRSVGKPSVVPLLELCSNAANARASSVSVWRAFCCTTRISWRRR